MRNKYDTKIQTHTKNKKEKDRITLTTATSNGAAASGVRVSFCSWLTVIIGCTPSRAWHGVPLQSSITYVLRARLQNAPVNLRVHIKLIVTHTLSHGALAAS